MRERLLLQGPRLLLPLPPRALPEDRPSPASLPTRVGVWAAAEKGSLRSCTQRQAKALSFR